MDKKEQIYQRMCEIEDEAVNRFLSKGDFDVIVGKIK